MRRLLLALFLLAWGINGPIHSQEQKKTASAHYLFAWTGDAANKRAGCSANCGAEGREGSGNDFLAVIDADPSSPSYGHLVTTVATDQQTMYAHHTEYTMPASGMLFANDHDAGRTFIFDVRDRCIRQLRLRLPIWPGTCIRIRSCGCPTGTCSLHSSTHITAPMKGT